jgi:protein-tyrosine phosphatase
MMPPFTVLHVCIGNICRSPMAERLFELALRRHLGDAVERLYLSHGAGTGSWHVGEPMNPPAARQVRSRGGTVEGFRARRIEAALIESADLILCATADQVEYVLELRPDAEPRTFVLGEFGRLLGEIDPAPLPASDGTVEGAYARGVALVRAVNAARAGRPSLLSDDLDDPWGRPDREFARTADQIEATVVPLAKILTG